MILRPCKRLEDLFCGQNELFESRSCASHPGWFLGKTKGKGQCYKMWVFQESPMAEFGWKVVLHLAWPEAEGLPSPHVK